MMADRLIRIFLGAIAVLLGALLIQMVLRSPTEAQAQINLPNSSKVYDVVLIREMNIPDVKEVTPLPTNGASEVNFAVRTKDRVLIFRCAYFPKR